MRAVLVLMCSFSLIAIAGCAGQPTLPGSIPTGNSGLVPDVRQKGGGSQWVDFLPKTTSTALYTYNGLVVGPDHNVWFQDMQGNGIVQIMETGVTKEFAVPLSENTSGGGMAVGSDNRFYVGATDTSTNIGYVDAMTTAGVANSYEIGTGEFDTDNLSGGLALGPDGNVWFVEYNHIGMITPAGAITQYAYPSSSYYANPGDIVKGSDGNMWFTTGGAGINPAYVAKIVPSSGAMTFYNLTSLVGCPFDNALTAGPDGNIWVDCGTHIVRVTTAGAATAFAAPSNGAAGEVTGDMTPGSSQTIWYGGANDSNNLVQYNITANRFSVFTTPTKRVSEPLQVIVGPDGNIWFAAAVPGSTRRMQIATYVLNPMRVAPTSLTLTAPGMTGTLTVTEDGVTSWTAKSSNRSVATVKRGASNQFTVTAVASGTCQITILDSSGNSVSVKVTVS